MDEKVLSNIKNYAKLFCDKKLIECGYIAVRSEDGILITETKADFSNIDEKDVVFVNDKNIDSFEGNFRAAAVILFCAIRQDGKSEAAVIADSDAILKYSSKRKALMAILDEVAQLCGITVKCATKNVAAEVVTSLTGQRNACFMPDAGAVIKARSLEEVFEATAVLDKACTAQLIADSNGIDTQRMNVFNALIEQWVFRFKTAKNFRNLDLDKKNDGGQKSEVVKNDSSDVPSAEPEAVANDAGTASDGAEGQDGENNDANNSANENNSENDNGDDADQLGKAVEFALFKDENNEEVALLMHPFYGSILSAIGKSMPVPEKYVEELGQEIPCANSAMTCTKKAVKNVCAVIGEAPACFIAGHGVVVRGVDKEDALSVCRTLEQACKLHLESK